MSTAALTIGGESLTIGGQVLVIQGPPIPASAVLEANATAVADLSVLLSTAADLESAASVDASATRLIFAEILLVGEATSDTSADVLDAGVIAADAQAFAFAEAEVAVEVLRSTSADLDVEATAILDAVKLTSLAADLQVSATISKTSEPQSATHLFSVSQDGDWVPPSTLNTTNTTIVVGVSGSALRSAFFRFLGVSIPKNAQISYATLLLVDNVNTVSGRNVSLQVSAQRTNFSHVPTSTDFPLLLRTFASSTSSVTTSSIGVVREFDVTAALQELVDLENWDAVGSGTIANAVTIFLDSVAGSVSSMSFRSIENSAGIFGAQLYVQTGDLNVVAILASLNAGASSAAAARSFNPRIAANAFATAGVNATVRGRWATAASTQASATLVVQSQKRTNVASDLLSTCDSSAIAIINLRTVSASTHVSADSAASAFVFCDMSALMEASARQFSHAERIVFESVVSNPPLPGDYDEPDDPNDFSYIDRVLVDTQFSVLTDYSNRDNLKLDINEQAVNLGIHVDESLEGITFSLLQLRSAYNTGKLLTFEEIPLWPKDSDNSSLFYKGRGYGDATFKHGDNVLLSVKEGNSFVNVFSGKIREIVLEGENNNEKIVYTAFGKMQLADEVYIEKTYEWSDKDGIKVSEALLQLLEDAEEDLQDLGIEYEGDFEAGQDFTVPDGFKVSGGVLQCLRQISQFAVNTVIHFNDRRSKWELHRPALADTIAIKIDETNLQSHSITESLDGRYTAILLREPEKEQSGWFFGNLLPGWSPNDESLWRMLADSPEGDEESAIGDLDGGSGSGFMISSFQMSILEERIRDVYRKYTYTGTSPLPLDQEGYLYVSYDTVVGYESEENEGYLDEAGLITFSGGPSEDSGLSDDPLRFEPFLWEPTFETVEAVLNCRVTHFKDLVFFELNQPPVQNGNAQDAGDAVPISFTRVTGAYRTRLSPSRVELRYPAEGFEGSAYTEAGLARVLVVDVGDGEATEERAAALLLGVKELGVSGSLPIDGEILLSRIELHSKLVFAYEPSLLNEVDLKSPPLSKEQAFVVSYTYDFGRRGVNTLEVTSDLSSIVGG